MYCIVLCCVVCVCLFDCWCVSLFLCSYVFVGEGFVSGPFAFIARNFTCPPVKSRLMVHRLFHILQHGSSIRMSFFSGTCVCSTSPPGGNQVDGLTPAPVICQEICHSAMFVFRENFEIFYIVSL